MMYLSTGKRRPLTMLLCALEAAALIAARPSHASVVPSLSAGSETVAVGAVFTIPISVSDLSFNPSSIQALSVDDSSIDLVTEAGKEGGLLGGITAGIDSITWVLSFAHCTGPHRKWCRYQSGSPESLSLISDWQALWPAAAVPRAARNIDGSEHKHAFSWRPVQAPADPHLFWAGTTDLIQTRNANAFLFGSRFWAFP